MSNQQKKDNAANELLKFIPKDARLVIEMDGNSNAIAEKCRQQNPHAVYMNLNESAEIPNLADCIIYNHSLENVMRPHEVLKRHTACLNQEGQVIACIANAQYWPRVAGLIGGKWEQRPEQLQFFTAAMLERLFTEAGLKIFDIRGYGTAKENYQEIEPLLVPLLKKLKLDVQQVQPYLTAENFIVRAVKSPAPIRRLLVQTMLISKMASDTIRVYEPDSFLETIPGVRTVAKVGAANLNAAYPNEEKVFIWQRQRLKYPDDLKKQRELIKRGYLIVAEIDDDPLFWPEHQDNNFITFRSAHCIQTSTEYLANILREFNPNVAVFPNQLAFIPLPRRYNADTVTIFFGAFNREKDWEVIMPVLNEVLPKYGDKVTVQVVYDRLFYDALNINSKQFEPLCTYPRYQQILNYADIALLPLNDTRFNHCKSDLKFIQCAAHGVAVLASPTVYNSSVIHSQTGLIYNNPAEFKAALQKLIEDTVHRQTIAQNAYQWVKNNRMLAQHYHTRHNWYLAMRDKLPELNRQLGQRVPEVFERV